MIQTETTDNRQSVCGVAANLGAAPQTAVTPTVSVVMVAYNQAHLIERAIKGVVRQRTRFGIQLIISDDASTDDTCRVAMEWQRKYPDIVEVYRNERNLGIQRNYLAAMSRARGEYIAMCDADDYWCDRSKVERQLGWMEAHPECAVTFHRVVNHYPRTHTMSLSNPGQKTETTIADLSRGNYITNCSVIYRRVLEVSSLPAWITGDVWPDYPLHMLHARHGSIHYFSRPMAVYRQGDTGAWTTNGRLGQLRKALKVREHLLEEFATDEAAREGLNQAVAAIHAAMETAGDVPRRLPAKKRLLRLIRQGVTFLMPLPRP
ncbi:MAG: glycosyltransferase [Muribaculaceae bacterium]|nr:glycosyltransferase [Muribaculaceae bacterium]